MKQFIQRKMGVNISGLRLFIKEDKSSQYLMITTVIVLFLTFVLKIGSLQTEIIILHIALTWVAEMVNTAIESAVDAKTTDYSIHAKKAKDIASSAVFASYVFLGINIVVSIFWN